MLLESYYEIEIDFGKSLGVTNTSVQNVSKLIEPMEGIMAWTAPKIEEVTCGMEINMYFPADDQGDLF